MILPFYCFENVDNDVLLLARHKVFTISFSATSDVPLTITLGPGVVNQNRFAEKKCTHLLVFTLVSSVTPNRVQRARRMYAKNNKPAFYFVMLYVLNA